MKEALLKIKEKCIRLGTPFPEWICVDNVRNDENTVHEVFPLCKVVQDVKHLINRVVENLSKKSEVYAIAAK